MSPSVYLAGPITGLSYAAATEWRDRVAELLRLDGIVTYSPMRHKEYLRGETDIPDAVQHRVLSSPAGIVARDFFDCQRADLLLVNVLGATRVSIGTVMEVAWALQWRKPVVLVMESQGNPHDHSFLLQACPFRVPNLLEALHVVKSILKP